VGVSEMGIGLRLTSRRHVDLLRTSSDLCPAR
jgi:hypothetical protein